MVLNVSIPVMLVVVESDRQNHSRSSCLQTYVGDAQQSQRGVEDNPEAKSLVHSQSCSLRTHQSYVLRLPRESVVTTYEAPSCTVKKHHWALMPSSQAQG